MEKRVLGVLGGGDTTDALLTSWAEGASHLYAADSGANRLLRMGLQPTVVGDLDSFDASLRHPGLRVVQDLDPDRTDCDKLLALVLADGHEEVTVAGVEGDLLDHVLASLSSIARSPLRIRLALRTGIAHVLRDGAAVEAPGAFGRRVSLVPIVRSTGASLQGVLWEFADAVLEPAGFLSVSNEGTGTVKASLATGVALLFVAFEPGETSIW